MTIPFYLIDAFAESLFAGNPAGVCLLNEWPEDSLMQNIAMENNQAETAFCVKTVTGYEIRWFTPTVEVDLCGHATLAAARAIFHHEKLNTSQIDFYSPRSGELTVYKNEELLTLNFPADDFHQVELNDTLWAGLGKKPVEAWKGKTDYMLVFANESEIRDINPNYAKIQEVADCRGVIVTAPGDKCDFVSRFFAPQVGINEDPVTGSAHTTLTPYWMAKSDKPELTARQISPRGGDLKCSMNSGRVFIGGKAQIYLKGELEF